MDVNPPLSKIAALIGEPARALMLAALMDDRSRTAGELAQAAGITPQTASAHLSKLVGAGLLTIEKQGRHRYHHLASGDVAYALEALMMVSAAPLKMPRPGPANLAQRLARTCYDHMAGEIAVQLADRWLAAEWLEKTATGWTLTSSGRRGIDAVGICPPDAALRRPEVRPCLDWSERRPHVGGQLGARMFELFLQQGWVRRRRSSRALLVTDEGERALHSWIRG